MSIQAGIFNLFCYNPYQTRLRRSVKRSTPMAAFGIEFAVKTQNFAVFVNNLAPFAVNRADLENE